MWRRVWFSQASGCENVGSVTARGGMWFSSDWCLLRDGPGSGIKKWNAVVNSVHKDGQKSLR